MNLTRDVMNIKQGDANKLLGTIQDLPGIIDASLLGTDKVSVEYDSGLINKRDIEESITLFYALK